MFDYCISYIMVEAVGSSLAGQDLVARAGLTVREAGIALADHNILGLEETVSQDVADLKRCRFDKSVNKDATAGICQEGHSVVHNVHDCL